MAAQPVQGVINFITSLKKEQLRADRDYLIREELVKIHGRLAVSSNNGYEQRKCLLKLVYIHMLGQDMDIGYMETINMMASDSFQVKMAGYMAYEVLSSEMDDLSSLVINTVRDDLKSGNIHVKALAINFIANGCSEEFNKSVLSDLVCMLLVSPPKSTTIRKKLYLGVTQILRINPELFKLSEWKSNMKTLMANERDGKCTMALVCLLMEFIRKLGGQWDDCISIVIESLLRILSSNVSGEKYYTLKNPWLVVRLLSSLALVDPTADALFLGILEHLLNRLLDRMNALKKNNIEYTAGASTKEKVAASVWTMAVSIATETVRVLVHWYPYVSRVSIKSAIDLVDRLISADTSPAIGNAISIIEIMVTNPDLKDLIKPMVPKLLALLSSSDTTIKSKVGVLVSRLCDGNNWNLIIPELLSTLRDCDSKVQSEIIPHMLDAIEDAVPLGSLYIDTVLQVVMMTHDDRSLKDVCRVLYSDSAEQQVKIAKACLDVIKGNQLNDTLLRICATMLGSYGHRVAEIATLAEQASYLKRWFIVASPEVQIEILHALCKSAARKPSLFKSVESFLEIHASHKDVSVQTSACMLLRMMMLQRPMFVRIMLEECRIPQLHDTQCDTSVSSNETDSNYHILNRTRSLTPTEESNSEASEDVNSNDELLEDRLLNNTPGLLFSDGNINIWVEQAYLHSNAKVLLRITNISEGNRKIEIKGADLHCNKYITGIVHNDIDGLLEPEGSICHKLSFVLRGIHHSLPKYTIKYTSGKSVEYTKAKRISMKLPVSLGKFMEPLFVDKADVKQLWESLSRKEVTKDISWRMPIQSAIEAVSERLNGHVSEADDNHAFICSTCEHDANYPLVSIVLLHMRPSGRRMTVAVRASSSNAVSMALQLALAALHTKDD